MRFVLQFHCAYIRYTAGLSVEEIWSVQSEPITNNKDANESASLDNIDDAKSVELIFEQNESEKQSTASIHDDLDVDVQGDIVNTSPDNSDYELVDDALTSGMDEEELDELDAEIARELAEIDDL